VIQKRAAARSGPAHSKAKIAAGKREAEAGTLDAITQVMSEMQQRGSVEDTPLDFTEFLSRRLGMETGTTLSMLGAFLLTFEPQGPGSAPSAARALPPPALFNI
jgi:hypothetical protein